MTEVFHLEQSRGLDFFGVYLAPGIENPIQSAICDGLEEAVAVLLSALRAEDQNSTLIHYAYQNLFQLTKAVATSFLTVDKKAWKKALSIRSGRYGLLNQVESRQRAISQRQEQIDDLRKRLRLSHTQSTALESIISEIKALPTSEKFEAHEKMYQFTQDHGLYGRDKLSMLEEIADKTQWNEKDEAELAALKAELAKVQKINLNEAVFAEAA